MPELVKDEGDFDHTRLETRIREFTSRASFRVSNFEA